jgi:hypothetical protein
LRGLEVDALDGFAKQSASGGQTPDPSLDVSANNLESTKNEQGPHVFLSLVW